MAWLKKKKEEPVDADVSIQDDDGVYENKKDVDSKQPQIQLVPVEMILLQHIELLEQKIDLLSKSTQDLTEKTNELLKRTQ